MQYLSTHKKWILFTALLVALGIATPVLADYLGPNRTVTQTVSTCKVVLYKCEYVAAKDIYKYKSGSSWSCSNESKPWQDYPSSSPSCNENNTGHQYWDREYSLEETTTTHPPATISGSLQNCTLENGWCNSGTLPQLSLSANEPLSGYNILLVEGTLNGVTFTCPGGVASCSVPLDEGDNNFAYWALSSWGDSSSMGTSTAKVDTVAPDVGLNISGTSGANGWYVSPTTVTAAGSDATSGLASALLSIDDVAWQPSITLNEGMYTVIVKVKDNAGNESESSTLFPIDTTTPTINMSVDGTAGRDNWYTSALQVSALASDATSLVATFEVSADGGAYQSYTAPVSFGDGHHTIRFKATDNAGNQTETPIQEFYVDTLAPVVDLPRSWQLGTNVPYSVQDDGSGLSALRIVIEDEDEKYAKVAWNQTVSGATYSQDIDWDGQFKDKTVAPPGTYLVWIKASDRAGNERFQLGKVIVPESNLFLSLLPTEEPFASTLAPTPPAELFEADDTSSLTTPPSLGFGGGTTETTTTTTHSLLLATGASAGSTATSSPGILWGAAAAAVIGAATAYALETDRKRKEAEAAQAAQAAAEIARDKEERAEREQKQQENEAKQKALDADILAYHQQQKQKVPPVPPPPSGISPEAQAAYLYGGAGAQGWINNNVPQLQQAYVKQKEQQKETARKWAEEKQAEEGKKAQQQSAAKVMAVLALDDEPPREEGFLGWLWSGVKTVWSNIFGTKEATPSEMPVQPDVEAITTQAYQTVVAQFTQAAQAIPTALPTFTASPTIIVTPAQLEKSMWVTYPSKFRHSPSLDNEPLGILSVASKVIFTGETKIYYDPLDGKSYTFSQVIADGESGWTVSNFLEPVDSPKPDELLAVNPNKNVYIDPRFKPPSTQKLPQQDLGLTYNIDAMGKAALIQTSIVNPNLCGEFASAYVTKQPIDKLITNWINQTDSYWKDRARNIIRNPGEGTGVDDLRNMLNMHECSYQDFMTPLHEPITDGPLVTPRRLKAVIDQGNSLIVGVQVSQSQGILNQGTTDHWVVVDDVLPQGINDGQVLIYTQCQTPRRYTLMTLS